MLIKKKVYLCTINNLKQNIMSKQYVIESKGFTQGIGSASYSKKRKEQLKELKRQIEEMEKLENKQGV